MLYRFRIEDKANAIAKVTELMQYNKSFEVCQPVIEEIQNEPDRYYIDIEARED